MKRKFIIGILAVIACIFCAMGLVACATGNSVDDTYTNNAQNPTVEKVTITYNANGGMFNSGNEVYTQQIDKNSLLTVPNSPMRTGYTFVGWAKSESGSDIWIFDEDKATVSVILYAMWTEKSAVILSVDGASIEDDSIYMLVDKDTDSVSLSDKVLCSSDSVWKLYFDKFGQTEISTKIAVGLSGYLSNGNNTFYIVVTSQDGATVNRYELTLYRSFETTVGYYDGNRLLKEETANTGYRYEANYTPTIAGYVFNGWKDVWGAAVNSFIVWDETKIYLDKTPLEYRVSYNANGGTGIVDEITIKSGESMVMDSGDAFSRDYYWLYGFNTEPDGTGTQLDLKQNITFNFARDLTLYAIWKPYFTYKASDSGIMITGFTYPNYYTDIEIPTEIDGQSVISISGNAFNNETQLRSVIIPNSVTSIVYGAFNGCSNLENITIPFVGISIETPTYLWQSVFGAIFGATSYPGGVETTQYYYNSSYELTAKSYIPSTLKTVTVTGGNIVAGAFSKCSGLKSITILNSVKSIGVGAFKNCTSLTSVTIPNQSTSIGEQAFFGCSALMNITIPTSVKSIGSNAFSGCSGLTNVTIPTSITSIADYMFSGCSGLTNIKIPTSVKSIGVGAFKNCISLTDINIPNQITSIGEQALYGCKKLTSIDIPDSVTSIGKSAFENCQIENATVPLSAVSYLTKKYLKSVIITSGKYIENLTFANCTSLTSITIPDSIIKIEESAFYNCTSLTSIIIPGNVVTLGDKAFQGCTSLTSITIPKKVVNIGSSVFSGCSSVASVKVESGNLYYHSAGNCLIETRSKTLLFGCKNSVIPADGSVTSIGTAFSGCTLLTSIVIPDSVPSLVNFAFSGCKSLTNVTIGNGVTSIGTWAFSGCSKLTSIDIPDNVTSIGEDAFDNCYSLTSVTIGAGVTSIDRYAFAGCSSLKSATFKNVEGWWLTSTDKPFSIEIMSNPTTCATYLRSTFCGHYWRCSK